MRCIPADRNITTNLNVIFIMQTYILQAVCPLRGMPIAKYCCYLTRINRLRRPMREEIGLQGKVLVIGIVLSSHCTCFQKNTLKVHILGN